MSPLQIARSEMQRKALSRREGERRRARLDDALAQSAFNRREGERRGEKAQRTADRIDAARFNYQLMRWHNSRAGEHS